MSSIVLKPVIPVQWHFSAFGKWNGVANVYPTEAPCNQFTIRKTTTNIMTLTIICSFGWCCTHLVRFFIGIQSKKVVHRATWYSHSEQERLCISSSEHGWKESVTWVIWERLLLSFYEAKRRFSACKLQRISFAQRADFNRR